jgi:putative ABC transport system substrate-binding protein
MMDRRDFISLLSGAAAWPIAARAQQPERIQRIGVLQNLTAIDPESSPRVTAFMEGLQDSGWTEGRNVRIEYRFAGGDPDSVRKHAAELVALAPDVILVSSGSALATLQRATRTIPIVFVTVTDPVGGGYVASLARPGGNTTGFTLFEYGTSGKWLELLKQIAPRVSRVAVIRDSAITSGTGQFAAIQAVAPLFAVELSPVDVREAGEIERSISAFSRGPNDGLIVTISPLATAHREAIIRLSAHHRLPTVYPNRYFATAGGLVSYGPDQTDPFRRAAGYVDRILKGEKPADLPVQAPTKYELVINLKTAKSLRLDIPPTLLAIANEVIE